MFNFFAKRLLKRAGLTPESLQDLVERGTKELDEIEEIQKQFEQNGQTLESAFAEWHANAGAALRKAKETADQRSAAQNAKVKRSHQLDDMLQKLRPGMHIREMHHIEAQFGDTFSPEALRNKENWLGAIEGKCVIDYDADGFLTRVHFFGATNDTLQIAATKQMQSVLQTCAGVVHAEDLEVHDKSLLRAVEIGTNEPNLTILAWFWCGSFRSTTYLTPSERERMADAIAAQRPPEPAMPEAQQEKTADQIAADTALRKVYYAWADQNDDETCRELVEWIITETSPDARHHLLGFNWDKGLQIPLWIIRQPGTYLATALKAFEMSDALYWLEKSKTNDPASEFAFELNERISNGFYATPTADKAISYAPRITLDMYPSNQSERIAPAVFEPLEGRDDYRIFCEIPDKFIDYLT